MEHALIGSTTERVLHKASCPVLTIPNAGDEPGSAERVRFTHVLCAIDFSPSSLKALAHGLSFAHESDAKVTLLHVLEMLSDEQMSAAWLVPVGEYVQQRRDEARHQLDQLVRDELRAGNEPALLVETGSVTRTILRVADQLNTDLIAIGARGRTAVGRMLFGSTTDTVIRHAVCPVITTMA
jgi:nucleotide-binding universal stress UspA family protein